MKHTRTVSHHYCKLKTHMKLGKPQKVLSLKLRHYGKKGKEAGEGRQQQQNSLHCSYLVDTWVSWSLNKHKQSSWPLTSFVSIPSNRIMPRVQIPTIWSTLTSLGMLEIHKCTPWESQHLGRSVIGNQC